jgi:hypothetical protein
VKGPPDWEGLFLRLGSGISAVSRLRDFDECGAELKQKAGFLSQKVLKKRLKRAKSGQNWGFIEGRLCGKVFCMLFIHSELHANVGL